MREGFRIPGWGEQVQVIHLEEVARPSAHLSRKGPRHHLEPPRELDRRAGAARTVDDRGPENGHG
jgi:hypothetical protein